MNQAKRNHPFSHYLRRFREEAAKADRRMTMYDAGEITDEEAERLMAEESRERQARDGAE